MVGLGTSVPSPYLNVPQFGRLARVQINGVTMSARTTIQDYGLDAEFSIKKDVGLEMTYSTVTVINPPKQAVDTVLAAYEAALALPENVRERGEAGWVTVEAGYEGNIGRLIRGSIVFAEYENNPGRTETFLRMKLADGGLPWKSGFVNASVSAPADLSILKTILESYIVGRRLGRGTAEAIAEGFGKMQKRMLGPGYPGGYVLFGEARDVGERFFASMDLRLITEDGEAYVLPLSRTTKDFALEVIPLQPPKFREFGLGTAILLLNPEAHPGRQIILRDEDLKPYGAGTFRIEAVQHDGATVGDGPWFTTVDVRPAEIL